MIELKKISKTFGEVKAVDSFSLQINRGELFGLLGPNGAGKSTTINMISGYMAPDSGEIVLNGKKRAKQKEELKNIIGIVPQEIALYDELTALENLQFWGEIYSISGKELKSRSLEMLKMVGLLDRRKDKIKTFSGGMKRRINIATGLIHNPQIILMDEPTVGVDPQSRNFIFEMIEGLHHIGKTIIYTTHYMEEAERLCDRIAVIDRGKLIALGSKTELLKLIGNMEKFTFVLDGAVNFEQMKTIFSEFTLTPILENKIEVYSPNLKNELSRLAAYFKSTNLEILDLDYTKPSLEELFLKLTGRDLRE